MIGSENIIVPLPVGFNLPLGVHPNSNGLDYGVHLLRDVFRINSPNPGEHVQRFLSAHFFNNSVELWTIANIGAGFSPIVANTPSLDKGIPLGDFILPGEHLEGGRLPGSIDTQQAETVADIHVEIDALDGFKVTVPGKERN